MPDMVVLGDKGMQLWSIEEGGLRSVPTTPNHGQTGVGAVSAAAWAPIGDPCRLAYGTTEGSLVLWKADNVCILLTQIQAGRIDVCRSMAAVLASAKRSRTP